MASYSKLAPLVSVVMAMAGACAKKEPAASPPPSATATPAAAPARVAALALGQAAPDFKTVDQDGKPVHLAELRGKTVVVYFYPRDETPGCTKEAESFRDGFSALTAKGAVLIGVSADDAASHKAFAVHHQLPFTLVSDPKAELAAKFGVPMSFGMTQRQTFVIAPDGTLKRIYRSVDVGVHAAEIAADVQ